MTISNYHFLGMDIKVNWDGPNAHPTEDAALPSAQMPPVTGTAQQVQVQDPEHVAALPVLATVEGNLIPAATGSRTGSEQTVVQEEKAKKAEDSKDSGLQELPVVLEKSGEAKEDSHEKGSKKDGKAPQQPTGEVFSQASSAVRSQLQQPELVKASLASEAPAEIEHAKPEKTPLASVLRDVPAVQEVLRAKIEENVPANLVDFSLKALVSFLQPQIEQKKLELANEYIERLMEVLIPSFLQSTQERFFSQLNDLMGEVRLIVEKGEKDWVAAYQAAGNRLLSGLEHITEQALREVDSLLDSGKKETSSMPTKWHRGSRHHK